MACKRQRVTTRRLFALWRSNADPLIWSQHSAFTALTHHPPRPCPAPTPALAPAQWLFAGSSSSCPLSHAILLEIRPGHQSTALCGVRASWPPPPPGCDRDHWAAVTHRSPSPRRSTSAGLTSTLSLCCRRRQCPHSLAGFHGRPRLDRCIGMASSLRCLSARCRWQRPGAAAPSRQGRRGETQAVPNPTK